MLFFAFIAPVPQALTLEATVRHLDAINAEDLPSLRSTSLRYLPNVLGEAEALTRRFPNASAAWIVRGKCEMRIAMFERAQASFRKAGMLGHPKGTALATRAKRYEAAAARLPNNWKIVNQLADEGNGYWLAACTQDEESGPQAMLEIHPDGTVVELARPMMHGAYTIGFCFGLRNVDRDSDQELVLENMGWNSEGGRSGVRVFKGKRGSWRPVGRELDGLWTTGLVDLDGDGVYQFAIREWITYHHENWIRLYSLVDGDFREVTRRYPGFIQKQIAEIRKSVSEIDRHDRHRTERIVVAEDHLRHYGYRL